MKLRQVRIQHIMDLPQTLSKQTPIRKTKICQISVPLLMPTLKNYSHFKYWLLPENIYEMTFSKLEIAIK